MRLLWTYRTGEGCESWWNQHMSDYQFCSYIGVEIREFHRDINRKSKYRGSPWMTHEGTSSDQVLAILKRVLRTE
jgi:hypothetical protein